METILRKFPGVQSRSFVDDIVIWGEDWEKVQMAVEDITDTFKVFGMQLGHEKGEKDGYIVLDKYSRQNIAVRNTQVLGRDIFEVDVFPYLGVKVASTLEETIRQVREQITELSEPPYVALHVQHHIDKQFVISKIMPKLSWLLKFLVEEGNWPALSALVGDLQKDYDVNLGINDALRIMWKYRDTSSNRAQLRGIIQRYAAQYTPLSEAIHQAIVRCMRKSAEQGQLRCQNSVLKQDKEMVRELLTLQRAQGEFCKTVNRIVKGGVQFCGQEQVDQEMQVIVFESFSCRARMMIMTLAKHKESILEDEIQRKMVLPEFVTLSTADINQDGVIEKRTVNKIRNHNDARVEQWLEKFRKIV